MVFYAGMRTRTYAYALPAVHVHVGSKCCEVHCAGLHARLAVVAGRLEPPDNNISVPSLSTQ